MSKVFEQFVQQVFGSNPHLYDEAKRIEAESKEAQYYAKQSEINPLNSTTDEWAEFGKPNTKNQLLKQ